MHEKALIKAGAKGIKNVGRYLGGGKISTRVRKLKLTRCQTSEDYSLKMKPSVQKV